MQNFRLVVTIVPLDSGGVDATHDFAGPRDKAVADALPGQGTPHIAHGLLLEALRREAYLGALAEMTRDPSYLEKYLASGSDTQREMESKLAEAATEVIHRGSKRLTPGAAQGVLEMMTKALEGPDLPRT